MRKILLATAAGFAALVADGVTPARAQSAAEVSGQTPQPGITGYVQGRYRFGMVYTSESAMSTAQGKIGKWTFMDQPRLWFGADGVAANGLRYGARFEMRIPAGAPAAGAPWGSDERGNMFFRRAFGYIGTPTLGQLRFGSGQVRAVEQMHVGHFVAPGFGALDSDFGIVQVVNQQLANSFWFSSSTGNNPTSIGYYTPQFFGFDAGISFGFNDSRFNARGCDWNATFTGCDTLQKTTGAGRERLRNIIDAMIRYRGSFGGVGVAVSGGFRTANTVDAIAPAASFKDPTGYILGAEVSFAGFTVGGMINGGKFNRGFTALPSAGNNSSSFQWQLGGRYTIGAITVGAGYHQASYEGNTAVAADRKDRGFAVGGSYSLAPGVAIIAEYFYSRVRENGVPLNPANGSDKYTVNQATIGFNIAW